MVLYHLELTPHNTHTHTHVMLVSVIYKLLMPQQLLRATEQQVMLSIDLLPVPLCVS